MPKAAWLARYNAAEVKRRLLNVVTALSTVLFVAACVLWARSFWVSDIIAYDSPGTALILGARGGNLVLYCPPADWRSGRGWSYRTSTAYLRDYFDIPGWPNPRFAFGLSYYESQWTWAAALPLWIPTLLFALAPAALTWTFRRRAAAGRCPKCGYDLCGTPDRCPECGAVPAVGAATI